MDINKKVAFYTLGCKLNFSETSTISREFEDGGFERVKGKDEKADIYIINTCSVTDHADKKCRNVIRKFIKNNPQAIVAVTGCYAQLKPQEIAAIEGVDLVIGNNEKGSLTQLVKDISIKKGATIHTCDTENLTSFFASFSSNDRTRAFLKVQDGCNYKCSYCTIPLARGASRNIAVEALVKEAEQIASKGQKEIVLTGVNIGDFGRTTGESFFDLVQALDKVEGIERYRISSIEPNLLHEELIDFCVSSSKFMPHFHIPIQSGSDKILGLMRRRYTTEMFRKKIELLKSKMADVFIGIDVIVGFPGETDEDFMDTYNFLESINPAFLHVFPYSERANTPAIEFEDKVSPQKSAERVKKLTELSDRLHTEFCERYRGTERLALIESSVKGGKMFGFTDNYIKVELPYEREKVGKIVKITI
ncbi:MAG: tRNA (N(6)-L-threonylcarbamoyladenosine(37)-C(2))-methylthiotransferase MtaB [Rikenellaceae bacterium]